MHERSLVLLLFLCAVSLLTTHAYASVIHVPQDFHSIQEAMDSSTSGDTVLVQPGVYHELLTSPLHDLLLASRYLFTQDSSDINQTVLDGEYQGTLLTVRNSIRQTFRLQGFTLRNGMGFDEEYYYFDRAGAIHAEASANLCVEDVLFLNNRAPKLASVLSFGQALGVNATGNLTLRHIACYGNRVDDSAQCSDNIRVYCSSAQLIVEDLVFDGGGRPSDPMYISARIPRKLSVQDIRVYNVNGGSCEFSFNFGEPIPYNMRGFRSLAPEWCGGCRFRFSSSVTGPDTMDFKIRNLEFSGGRFDRAAIFYSRSFLDIDSLHVHHNVDLRQEEGQARPSPRALIDIFAHAGGSLSHAHFHHNLLGDSLAARPSTRMLDMCGINLRESHFHDNQVVIPFSEHATNELSGAFVYNGELQRHTAIHVENVLMENNLLTDLDDYQNHPQYSYEYPNYGRELYLKADEIYLRNVTIRNSMQPNHCLRLQRYSDSDRLPSGGALWAYARRIEADHLHAYDLDDGGFYLSADTLLCQDLVIQNVESFGISFRNPGHYAVPGFWQLRNCWISGVRALADLLPDPDDPESFNTQTALICYGVYRSNPEVGNHILSLENCTLHACEELPNLMSFVDCDLALRVHNSIVTDNSCEHLVMPESNVIQEWNYCYLQRECDGTGNILGMDPLFDPARGAPVLTMESPCVDTGDPDAVYCDREDPYRPGSALWPSLAGLRSDIGCTGGPHTTAQLLVNVEEPAAEFLPPSYCLGAAYPNPFNPTTTIPFVIQQAGFLRLELYNLCGQRVALLAEGEFAAGKHRVTLDGSALAGGLYILSLQGQCDVDARKVLLLK